MINRLVIETTRALISWYLEKDKIEGSFKDSMRDSLKAPRAKIIVKDITCHGWFIGEQKIKVDDKVNDDS